MGKRVNDKSQIKTAPKRVEIEPDFSGKDRRFLVWRFGRLDHETEFGCQTLVSTDVKALEQELAVFQREPIWRLRRNEWLKFIPAKDMTRAGQEALQRINKQEEGLWQLHLHDERWRIYGYYEEPEYFFLWWDGGKKVATGRSRRRTS
jgi:hypothetical protein